MTNKELDNYMKTVSPNFDSHIEKGTIEMNNEYYNLLEEKMARLINETQELKKQLEEANKKLYLCTPEISQNVHGKYVSYVDLVNEMYELKKQLEDKEDFIKKLQATKDRLDKYNYKITMQQQEFIKYLEDEKDRLASACSNIYEDGLGHTRLVNEDKFDEVNDILQKYKEIIEKGDVR